MLGKELREYRKSIHKTQSEISHLAGISVPTLRMLENGHGNLSSFFKVLNVLNLEVRGRNLPPSFSVGNQISKLRKRRDVNQRELALLAKSTQPTIVNLEKRTRGRLSLLGKCLDVLGAGAFLSPKDDKQKFYTSVGNASVQHNWHTPAWLLEKLYTVFEIFDLDPCSPTNKRKQAPVKAKLYYTASDDGLSLPWCGKVFVNPPYGRAIKAWIQKAHLEHTHDNTQLIVALVPARTDTVWWHEFVAGKTDVLFLRGRLSFGDCGQSAPFPSALILWGCSAVQLENLHNNLPTAWIA